MMDKSHSIYLLTVIAFPKATNFTSDECVFTVHVTSPLDQQLAIFRTLATSGGGGGGVGYGTVPECL